MAIHSSVLAWRIPGTGEPRGLPSMGSHRVGHDWSDLAAAAPYIISLAFTIPSMVQRKYSLKARINVFLLYKCLSSSSQKSTEEEVLKTKYKWGKWVPCNREWQLGRGRVCVWKGFRWLFFSSQSFILVSLLLYYFCPLSSKRLQSSSHLLLGFIEWVPIVQKPVGVSTKL